MPRYLFSTGSARGGTGLLTQMLSVSPKIDIALDPYLALFKSYRSAVVRAHGSEALRKAYAPAEPLQDYYFSDSRREVLDHLHKAGLDLPFPASEQEELTAALKARAALSSGDLIEGMEAVRGRDYFEAFTNALEHIRRRRGSPQEGWIGIHENWAVEFLVPLARAFPEAKFMVLLRDPRAVVSSNLMVKEEALRGHALSYARCLRKLMACALHYETLPVFQGRLMILRYEDIIRDPEPRCRELCRFLEVEFDPRMLDSERWIDPGTGKVYEGFSSYESRARGFSTHRIDRWKKHLPEPKARLTDLVCGPEMGFFGYEALDGEGGQPHPEALKALIEDDAGPKAWRCDSGSAMHDYGFELFRRAVLDLPEAPDEPLVRRLFLFPSVYERLRRGNRRTATAPAARP